MKQWTLALIVLALSSIALIGCRAEGEIDGDAQSTIGAPR